MDTGFIVKSAAALILTTSLVGAGMYYGLSRPNVLNAQLSRQKSVMAGQKPLPETPKNQDEPVQVLAARKPDRKAIEPPKILPVRRPDLSKKSSADIGPKLGQHPARPHRQVPKLADLGAGLSIRPTTKPQPESARQNETLLAHHSSGQISSGQNSSGQVSSGQVSSGQNSSGQVSSGQVSSGPPDRLIAEMSRLADTITYPDLADQARISIIDYALRTRNLSHIEAVAAKLQSPLARADARLLIAQGYKNLAQTSRSGPRMKGKEKQRLKDLEALQKIRASLP